MTREIYNCFSKAFIPLNQCWFKWITVLFIWIVMSLQSYLYLIWKCSGLLYWVISIKLYKSFTFVHSNIIIRNISNLKNNFRQPWKCIGIFIFLQECRIHSSTWGSLLYARISFIKDLRENEHNIIALCWIKFYFLIPK